MSTRRTLYPLHASKESLSNLLSYAVASLSRNICSTQSLPPPPLSGPMIHLCNLNSTFLMIPEHSNGRELRALDRIRCPMLSSTDQGWSPRGHYDAINILSGTSASPLHPCWDTEHGVGETVAAAMSPGLQPHYILLSDQNF